VTIVRTQVQDAAGSPLRGPVVVSFERTDGGGRRRYELDDYAGEVIEVAVPPDPYVFRASAEGRLRVVKVVLVSGDSISVELRLPYDPKTIGLVRPVEIPGELVAILDLDLDALDDLELAGLMNVYAKAGATEVAPEIRGSELLRRVFEARQDRIYAELSSTVREVLAFGAELGYIDRVSGGLHEPPRSGYELAGSYKSRDRSGNLQVTVFDPPTPDLSPIGDLDVDEARGLAHLFDVVGHHASGGRSHPYEIREILLSEGVDPGFELQIQ
jgi:hypothetical protein